MGGDTFLLFLWGAFAFLIGGMAAFVATAADGGKRVRDYRRQISSWMRYRIRRRGQRGRGVGWVFSPVRRLRATFALASPPLLISVVGFALNYFSERTYIPGGAALGFLSLVVGGWFGHLGMRALTARDGSDLEAECVFAALTTPAGTPERFLQFFSHPELDFRFAALTALLERPDMPAWVEARAAEVAAAFISDKSLERRATAYDFLSRRAPNVLRERLGRALEHPVADVRRHALKYVHVLSPGERNAALKSRLGDVKADVSTAAAKLLNEHPKNVEEYLADLREGSIPLRTLAAEYFAGKPDARAFDGLAALLNVEDWKARKAAAAALGLLATTESEAALTAFCANVRTYAANDAPERRDAFLEAMEGLRRLVLARQGDAPREVVRAFSRLVADFDFKVGKAAAAALLELRQIPELKRLYETGMPAVREIVLLTLADCDDDSVLPIFRQGLESPDTNVAKAAAAAIARSPAAEDAVSVTPLLRHNDPTVVYAAVSALGKMGAIPTLPALTEFLRRTEALMRRTGAAYAGDTEIKQTIGPIYDKAVDAVQRIVKKQSSLPAWDVEKFFCRKCHSRFRESAAEKWKYIECKRCRDDRHYVAPVDRVIGFIGDVYETGWRGGVFYSRLWDEESKSALEAEIDEMWIAGGAALSYDWATSAVVQKLQESGLNVPVKIVGSPELSANTTAMLNAYCPDFAELH